MPELIWSGKHNFPKRDVFPFSTLETIGESLWYNRLIQGDKEHVLPSLLPEFYGKIDLIYIDPPFGPGTAFDTWKVTAAERRGGITKLDKYLQWFYETAILLRELLAPSGSICVHMDYRADSYVRLTMDEIFGYKNLRNKIAWVYTRPGVRFQKQFSRVHDSVLWYSKSTGVWTFNIDDIRIPYNKKTIERGKYSVATSKMTRGIKKRVLHAKGKCPEDWWHIPIPPGNAAEYLGYPTQKPEALLTRIILASSVPNNLVLDCFAGSGTTAAVAERLGRRWIACDISELAISTTRERLLKIANVKPFVVQRVER